MRVAGIVAEYNPFHNGHLYQVQKTRELYEAEYIVAVMSGHFLQRGEPALFNKWARAKMAVKGGVDMVVELPAAFSVRSANYFAYGAVATLDAMGVVTHLSFGSEAGDIEALWPAARLLNKETEPFKARLKQYLDEGLSYPSARARALEETLPDAAGSCTSDGLNEAKVASPLLSSPNNILGIEYMRVLLALKSAIQPVTVKRIAAGYHDRITENDANIASATGIRDALRSNDILSDKIKSVIPSTTAETMTEEMNALRGPVYLEHCRQLLFYILRTATKEQLARVCDISEGFENRLLQLAATTGSVEDLLKELKTKRFTWTRIQRILSYILLDFTQEKAHYFDSLGPQYIRVLGLSSKGRELLKTVKKKASLPVITRTAPLLKAGGQAAELLHFDVKATDIYNLLYPLGPFASSRLDLQLMPYVEK